MAYADFVQLVFNDNGCSVDNDRIVLRSTVYVVFYKNQAHIGNSDVHLEGSWIQLGVVDVETLGCKIITTKTDYQDATFVLITKQIYCSNKDEVLCVIHGGGIACSGHITLAQYAVENNPDWKEKLMSVTNNGAEHTSSWWSEKGWGVHTESKTYIEIADGEEPDTWAGVSEKTSNAFFEWVKTQQIDSDNLESWLAKAQDKSQWCVR